MMIVAVVVGMGLGFGFWESFQLVVDFFDKKVNYEYY